jgi:hypothetical protein
MKKDFSTQSMNVDQSSASINLLGEAPNDPNIIEEGAVPHAGPELNDENGADLPHDTPRVKSPDESQPLTPTSAIKSGGPRTVIGKTIASKNALKHGIFSSAMLLKSESRAEYDSLLSGLDECLKPEGTLERFLVEKLAVLIWRYRRLIITETAEITSGGNPLDFDSNSDSTVLNRFPRYETSIDRAFDRTLTQLERLQRMRLGQPVGPLIKVDISS